MKKPLLSALALGAALSLPSPALAADGPPVRAQILGVRDVTVGLNGLQFTVVALLERTRGLPIVIKGITYRLQVGDLEVSEGWTPEDKVKLKKGAPVEVEIPVRISASLGLDALAKFGRKGIPAIKVMGEAKGRIFIFPGSFGFETELFKPKAGMNKDGGKGQGQGEGAGKGGRQK